MAEGIRINKLIRKYNVGLAELVEFLHQLGEEVEMKPNALVPEAIIPALDSHYCGNHSTDVSVDPLDRKLMMILENYDRKHSPSYSGATEDIEDFPVSKVPIEKTRLIEDNGLAEDDELHSETIDSQQTASRYEEQEDEFTFEEIIERIEVREKGFLEYMFSNAKGAAIHEKREIVKQILDSKQLYMTDFWYFIFKLLEIDESIYRGPICDSVYNYKDIDSIYCKKDSELIKASKLLFRDKEKCHQAIHFFFPFRNVLDPIVKQDIKDATRYISTVEELEIAFNVLGSDIHEIIYLLSVNETPASQYYGFISLKKYKELHGKEAVKALKYFPTYMNCIYDYLSFKLINKIVLEDNSVMTDKDAEAITANGFDSYYRRVKVAEGRESKKRMTANIQELVGKEVRFQFAGENKWNIFGSTNVSCGFILPKSWAKQDLTQGLWYQATVVKAVTNPNLLVLSQKKLASTNIPKISTVYVGEYVEARFSLFNDKVNVEILGHGPTFAKLVSIPRNFDYKKKHLAKVISVYNVNKCEIEIAD